jgi:phytoene desaturase
VFLIGSVHAQHQVAHFPVRKRILILGGGIGGLAAAVRLAPRFDVVLVEKNERVGGKLNLWEIAHPSRPNDHPFRFDTGPSLLTMPFVFMDLFAAAGQDVRDHLSIQRLDPVARFGWLDGATLDLKAGAEAMRDEIKRFSPTDARAWDALMQQGRRIWDLSEAFLSSAPEQMTASGPVEGLRMLSVPFRIGMFRRYASAINRRITHPRLRDVLYQYATYSGASPFKTPATMAVIPWVEHYFGGWHIDGGMYRLAESITALAIKRGVNIVTGAEVAQILIDGATSTATGVRLADGTEHRADAIICNADVVHTYRKLIDPKDRPHFPDEKLDNFEPGGSGFILMLGVDGTYPQLVHHNKFMPDDYRAELDAMFIHETIPADPCLYVCAPTRTDPALAPEGCEALFILVSAPSLQRGGIDWNIEGPRYRDRIVQALETRRGFTDLSRRIVVEKSMSPADLKARYNANAGSIYGIASNSMRTAFMRPPNRDAKIKRLYFAGGATHPGGGLPLVALSGKIAAQLAARDLE